MQYKTSQRLDLIQPSATLLITSKAKALKAAGKDVISFSAGEPDFDTPEHIKEAAIQALADGQTKYTAVGGSPAMKAAVIKKFERDNQLSYQPNEVSVANGGKHSLYNIFMASLNAGDEVILPTPAWVSYTDQIKLAEAKPIEVFCDVSENYLLSASKLEAAITPRTRMLILNSPSNPTGAAYEKHELLELGKVLQKHPEILIVSDDIYEHIIYNDFKFYNLPMLLPELKERSFIVNGVSKAYSMTGWRIGFCGAPAPFIKAMEKLQSQVSSNSCSIAQAAAIAALTAQQDCVEEMRQAFSERRDLVHRMLNAMPGVQLSYPRGAFYIFPDMSRVYQSKRFLELQSKEPKGTALSQTFCKHLLEHYEVATVPGIAFGYDNAIRISYALSDEQLRKGLERIGNMLQDLGVQD